MANGNPGDTKSVGQGVWEMRIDHGPGYRVYFLRRRETLVILLCGGEKSTQRRDIEQAHGMAKDWE
ncbi:MAG TPA: type II toxin-antitoxin system RelE/ParE family toxin [Segeticoccus sp.]|nr:type II toxin-antitoxin system RelE/ParE family toxin [Segeticoccus sp.]